MKFSATLAVLGGLLAPVLAGTCTDVGVTYRCGRVINESGKTMSYTTNPNQAGAPNQCRFWNWSDGPSNALVPCTQRTLASGGSAGCGSCSTRGTDVDAFTFNGYAYYWQGAKITKGVWTKISDLTTAKCDNKSIYQDGLPWCY